MTGVAPQRFEEPGPGFESVAPLEWTVLPRMQLFEFNELSWFPEILRNAITDILRILSESLAIHEVIRPVLEHLIRQSGVNRVVDLCSGAGGPIVSIASKLAHPETVVYLTDKFPNRDAFNNAEQVSGGRIVGYPHSVDATAVPDRLCGLRTLFNAFHHFPPQVARSILMDAYLKRQPIAVFELTDRRISRTLSNFILSFLTALALAPKMRPRRLLLWALTYAVPVLPLAFGWDGFVSCLRSYTASEIRKLLPDRKINPNYIWTLGRLKVPKVPVQVTYLTGHLSPLMR